MRKGEALALELRAQQLGSPLQGVLTVCDAQGKELAQGGGGGGPARPRADVHAARPTGSTASASPTVSTRAAVLSSPTACASRRPTAGFRLQLAADVLTLPRGGQAKLKVTADRLGGFTDAIALTIDGLPAGVKAANTIDSGRTERRGNRLHCRRRGGHRREPAHDPRRGEDEGRQVRSSQTAVLPAPRGQPETDTVLLAVALPTPFKIVGDYESTLSPRGSIRHRHYRIDRGGYDGPIEVSLSDRQARHLQGVHGPTVVVPAGANEFDYAVELPPWMEIGRTARACVMGVGVVKEGGADRYVSYSSVAQNDQIIAVVETGRLSVEVEKPAIVAARGKSVAVPVKVGRGKGLAGPVKVELVLPAHLHGVSAEPVVVAADQSAASV